MLDFEENVKMLNNLKVKLKEIGDSLWHFKIRKRVNKSRK